MNLWTLRGKEMMIRDLDDETLARVRDTFRRKLVTRLAKADELELDENDRAHIRRLWEIEVDAELCRLEARLEARIAREAAKTAERENIRRMWGQIPGSRTAINDAKHTKNVTRHTERPRAKRHLPKKERPRCGVACGHPLRPKPCQAPVVAGRAPDGTPAMGKHCRRHGGWS